MDEKERFEMARKRVEDLKGFYMHLFVYIIVNLGLFLLNILTAPRALWFYWPLIGWGIGVAIHGFVVLVGGAVFGKNWEEKKIREIMGKDIPK